MEKSPYHSRASLSFRAARRTHNGREHLPLIPPLLPVNAEPTCEADEPAETAVSVQSSRPTTNFALPRAMPLLPSSTWLASAPLATALTVSHPERRYPSLQERAQPAHVGRSPRLEAMKPTTRLIVQKPAAPTLAVVIDLEAVRKAVQSSPAAKHAA